MKRGVSITLRFISIIIILFLLLLNIEEVRTFIIAFALRVLTFIERNIITIFMSFLLVKGKFVWIIFIKKITILSVTGLGKRYLTEKVFIHHLTKNLLNPLRADIIGLIDYIKKYFTDFNIVKKIISIFIFLSSLSYIAKYMGIFLAIKVVLAKIWSFLLAFFLKISTAFIYFFTNYIWNSWITPILEIFIFSWFFSLMEKVPFINRFLQKIYAYFQDFILIIDRVLEKMFHIPLRLLMGFLVKFIRKLIRRFINIKHKSKFQELKYSHNKLPNSHIRLKIKRDKRKKLKKKSYQSIFKRLKSKRR
ncbi:hypothetical protein MNB_SV-9-898 [hydrothermal vent metagenome]|uniref:Uncharacterized protein n=1 Tax=hydrothermal vent metagenome TaxID=652676 RepID=A0A1W1BJ14_9ZZZZ